MSNTKYLGWNGLNDAFLVIQHSFLQWLQSRSMGLLFLLNIFNFIKMMITTENVFNSLNFLVLLGWIPLLVFPFSRFTKKIVDCLFVPFILCFFYIYFLSQRKISEEKKLKIVKNTKLISLILLVIVGGYFLSN